MRVGVLTGGGDCPGLNAVIRAVVRKGVQEYGQEFVGFRDGWRGPLEGDTMPLDVQAVRGILPRGGTILGSSRTNPLKSGQRRSQRHRADQGQPGGPGRRRADRDRRRGHARRRHQAGRAGGPGRRRAEDDRQRPRRHRLHLRLRHGREHRHGGHRPAAHHGGKPPPGADRRGHGPARRLDRAARGAGRRRERHPHPGAAVRHRAGLRLREAPVPDQVLADRGRLRGRSPGERATRHQPPGSSTRSATCGWAASGRCWPRRSRSGPARRRATRCSATSSAAARRRRSTACWPPGSACMRSRRCTTRRSASWWRCAAPTSSGCRSPRPPPAQAGPAPALRRSRGLLRLARTAAHPGSRA